MTRYNRPQYIAMPFGQAMELIEQVQYEKNGFVIRSIIDEPNGTCKLAALEEGQGRGEHTAPFIAFVYILEGETEITISEKSHILKQGEMIMIPANEPHALTAKTRLKLMSVMIKS